MVTIETVFQLLAVSYRMRKLMATKVQEEAAIMWWLRVWALDWSD